MIKGIDVSRHQGAIDWAKVARSGVEFAIIKAGGSDGKFGSCYTDPQFKANIIGAFQNGIHIGTYYYVGKKCTSAQEGQANALRFYDIIKEFYFDYPVYIDFEAPNRTNKQGNTDAVKAFCEQMEALGYYVGIYASDISGFKERLYLDQLTAYDKWVARYGSEPKYATHYNIWQYSSKGKVDGIRGNVDLDYCKIDLSKIIREKHLNGF